MIASSPTDVGPVLKAIVESACELCEAYDAVLVLKDGEDLRFSAHHGPIPMTLVKWPINRNWTAGRAFVINDPCTCMTCNRLKAMNSPRDGKCRAAWATAQS